mgnify:CR=1 FL=1
MFLHDITALAAVFASTNVVSASEWNFFLTLNLSPSGPILGLDFDSTAHGCASPWKIKTPVRTGFTTRYYRGHIDALNVEFATHADIMATFTARSGHEIRA